MHSEGERLYNDVDRPTARMNTLPSEQRSTTFTVSWSGDDGGTGASGVKSFTVLYQKEGESSWHQWNVNTTSTSASFTGERGKKYYFCVVSYDNVGHDSYISNTVSTYILKKFSISTNSSPTSGGSTSGGGTYYEGEQACVSASPASGWSFKYWKEGTSIVSRDKNYCFTVNSNRWLTAYFERLVPDLTVTSVWINPSSPKEGGNCTLFAKVKNIGNGNSSSTIVKWYIDGNLFASKDVSALSPGQEVTVEKPYTFTNCGSYELMACIESVSGEENTSNNCKTTNITVQCTYPDLIITREPWMSPSRPATNETFTVYAEVKNIGDKESNPTTVRWSLNGKEIATANLHALSPEENKQVSATATLSESRKGRLKVSVDPLANESNKNNNSRESSVDFEVSIEESNTAVPDKTILYDNYPNPFNASTVIKYYLKEAADVVFTIYDIKGNKVYEYNPGKQNRGFHTFTWDGRNSEGKPVNSGIYFYVFKYNNKHEMKRLLYIK